MAQRIFGDLAAFSLCQDKIITTGGEGGLLAMDDEGWWRTAWALKDHGKRYQAICEREHPPGFRYVYESFGTNWRMLEVQAAIGRLQLRKLPDWSERRHAIGSRIDAHGVPCDAGSAVVGQDALRAAHAVPPERARGATARCKSPSMLFGFARDVFADFSTTDHDAGTTLTNASR